MNSLKFTLKKFKWPFPAAACAWLTWSSRHWWLRQCWNRCTRERNGCRRLIPTNNLVNKRKSIKHCTRRNYSSSLYLLSFFFTLHVIYLFIINSCIYLLAYNQLAVRHWLSKIKLTSKSTFNRAPLIDQQIAINQP